MGKDGKDGCGVGEGCCGDFRASPACCASLARVPFAKRRGGPPAIRLFRGGEWTALLWEWVLRLWRPYLV